MVTNQFEIIKFPGELYGENTFLCIDKESNEAILIDPGTLTVDQYLQRNQEIKLVAVLLTHGHSDHILHTDFYVEKYQVPLYIHEKDAPKLIDENKNLSVMGQAFIVESLPQIFKGNDGILQVGSFQIEYQLAAGHSEGLVIFHLINTNIYFVGDTVFEDSIGRYDLPGSDARAHFNTLNEVSLLPEDSKFYPGHGRNFTKSALVNNAVFQMFIKMGV